MTDNTSNYNKRNEQSNFVAFRQREFNLHQKFNFPRRNLGG